MAKEKSLYEEFLDLREGKVDEKSVEPVYRKHILKWLQDNSMWFRKVDPIFTDTLKGSKTDGYLKGFVITDDKDEKPFCFLLEVKKGNKFDNEDGRIYGLCQVIYYLHDLNEKGIEVPTVALIGDLYNCFCFSTKHFIDNYINSNKYNWSVRPSGAFDKQDEKLFEDLKSDTAAQKIYGTYERIEKGFSISNTIIPKIRGYALASDYKNPITEKNMLKVFTLFSDGVLDEKEKLNPRQKVAIFMSLLTGAVRDYANSRELDCQAVKGVEKIVKVNSAAWISFKFNYDWEIRGSVLEKIIASSDALIETEDRRRNGDYYTPDIWRDKALNLMDENILDEDGQPIDWYNDFIVWDCCSGPKILTSSADFNHLYCSTLHGNELKLLGNYCANDFQYDFLNDDIKAFDEAMLDKQSGNEVTRDSFGNEKLEISNRLLEDLLSRKRPLLFFVNPPYASDKNGGSDTKSKAGTTDTLIKEHMDRVCNLGKAGNELYVQFLYRMLKIAELFDIPLYIGVFSKTSFLASDSFSKFREYYLAKMKYLDSFYINGSEFKGVSKDFGIMFSLWKSDKNGTTNKNEFKTTVYHKVDSDYKIENKIIYNIDNQKSLKKHMKPVERGIVIDTPQMKNALEYYEKPNAGNLLQNSLGYLVCAGNNVEQSSKLVLWLSSGFNTGHGYSVTVENFLKCTSGFMARKIGSDKNNWVNSKDEFLAPNEKHELYQQWVNDSVVYSLFNTQSQQSSLTNVKYSAKKEKRSVRCVSYNENEDTYRIKNEFFFMSRKEIYDLADRYYPEMYQKMKPKMRKGQDRFVYTLLEDRNSELSIGGIKGLSEDAKDLLELAKDILIHTFPYRQSFTEKSGEGEKYQVYNWDAGWYQIFGVDDQKGGRTGLVGWILKNYENEHIIYNDDEEITNPDCLEAKVKKFIELYAEFGDSRRDLVKELGYLK